MRAVSCATASCPFCRCPDDLRERTFHDKGGWFAFLDLCPLTRGHVVLARTAEEECPQGLTKENLSGHDDALLAVLGGLRRYYEGCDGPPKDFLFASLRQKVRHVHTHVLPLWADDEAAWRVGSHAQGKMWAFLAYRDDAMYATYEKERPEERSARQQRLAATAEKLRKLGD
jgi:diadenosine tetraphosphate (Ap4A) HIT family hydrolase